MRWGWEASADPGRPEISISGEIIPRSRTSIPYLDPIPRSCSNFSAENPILSTQRIVDWLSTKPPGGRSCRKRQFYNSKMHRGRMFFEMGGDPAEKGSFTIVKRIAAECFLKWGRSCRKKQFYKSKTHRGRMFFELNRRVFFSTQRKNLLRKIN